MPAVQYEPVKQARPECGQLIITKVPGKTPCPLGYLTAVACLGWVAFVPRSRSSQLIVKSVRLIACFPPRTTSVVTDLAAYCWQATRIPRPYCLMGAFAMLYKLAAFCAKKPPGTKQWLADPCRPELDGMSLGGRQELESTLIWGWYACCAFTESVFGACITS